MQLRELTLPVAILHPDFLTSIKKWGDHFDNVSSQSLETDYFLPSRIFDIAGHEYKVDSVVVLPSKLWGRLFGNGAMIDLKLRLVGTHSLNQLKERFKRHLIENPTWWMNNDEVWSEVGLARTFESGSTIEEVIQKLEWFSDEVN